MGTLNYFLNFSVNLKILLKINFIKNSQIKKPRPKKKKKVKTYNLKHMPSDFDVDYPGLLSHSLSLIQFDCNI